MTSLFSALHSMGNTASSFLQKNLGFLIKEHGRITVWDWLVINQQCCPVSFKISFFLLHKNIQNYDFACCFLWVSKLVSHTEGGTCAEGVCE
jgi:hypothetical protein